MKTLGGTTSKNSSKGGLAMDFVNLLGLSDIFFTIYMWWRNEVKHSTTNDLQNNDMDLITSLEHN
jgi:hypothetical protein